MAPVVRLGLPRARRRRTRHGTLVVAPFHSTANPPVGLAYLVPHLAAVDVDANVRDLNIEGRQFLATTEIEGVSGERRRELAEMLFPQARRSYLGEALTWAWLDPGGREAVARRALQHPSALLRTFWSGLDIERLTSDASLGGCIDSLQSWYEAQIASIVADGTVDWVGFSLTVSNQAASFHAAGLLRQLAPDVELVVGGPHVTPRNAANLLRSCPALDAAVPTPAYDGLVEWLRDGTRGSSTRGVWTRVGDDIVASPGPAPFPSMDELHPADWSIVELTRYEPSFDVSRAWGSPQMDRRTVPLQTSRGCSYGKCEFCHNVVDYPSYLGKSPSAVVSDLAAQVEGVSARNIFFTDDEFNGSKRRTTALAAAIARSGIEVRWFAWLRLDKIDRTVLEAMYGSGCRAIFVGVEAVDDDLLHLLEKGYSAELAIDRLRLLHEFSEEHPDFTYSFNLIFGHPLEAPGSSEATLAALCAEPELFVGHVSALCRYHVYEGTPAANRYDGDAVDCLQAIVPPGLAIDGFRLLVPGEVGALETWSLIAEVVSAGRRRRSRLAQSSMYD